MGETVTPFDGHYLVVTPADDPDWPTWLDRWDWTVEHPDTCLEEPHPLSTDEFPFTRRDCVYEWDIEQAGRDAFGIGEDELAAWGVPPLRVPLAHVLETYRYGYLGAEDYEISTHIVPAEEVEGA